MKLFATGMRFLPTTVSLLVKSTLFVWLEMSGGTGSLSIRLPILKMFKFTTLILVVWQL